MTNYDDNDPNPWGIKNLIYIEYFLLAIGIFIFFMATSVSVVPDTEPTPFPTQIPPPSDTPTPVPTPEYIRQHSPQIVYLYEYDLPADSLVYRQNVIFITDPCSQHHIANINSQRTADEYSFSEYIDQPTP